MRVRMILLATAVGVVMLPASAAAQATGEIGGPPTMSHLPFPAPHKKKTFLPKATTAPVVIGVGLSPFDRVEIVGQGSKAGLCIFIDHLKRGGSSGSCGPITVPRVIAADLFTWETRAHRSKSLSELFGFMQPTVAAVTPVAHLPQGRKRTRKAGVGIVAVPSADLLARLGVSTPFGFFAADFRGCLADAKVRLHAFDATGLLLGTSGINLSFPKRFNEAFTPCKPGFGFAFFGKSAEARTAVAP